MLRIPILTTRFCSTPDPWLTYERLKAPGLFVRLLAFWIVCVTVLVKNATLKQYLATRLLMLCTLYCYILYRIQVVHDTVNDVIKPSYTNICILVQKVIIRNINYMSDRMRPRVTSMHYLCCRSFLSVCSFTNDNSPLEYS